MTFQYSRRFVGCRKFIRDWRHHRRHPDHARQRRNTPTPSLQDFPGKVCRHNLVEGGGHVCRAPMRTTKQMATDFGAPRRVAAFLAARFGASLRSSPPSPCLGGGGWRGLFFVVVEPDPCFPVIPAPRPISSPSHGEKLRQCTSGTTGTFQLGDGSFTLTGDTAKYDFAWNYYVGTGERRITMLSLCRSHRHRMDKFAPNNEER
jgi:hypothetical protein